MRLSFCSRRLVPVALIALAALGLESAAGAPAGAPKLSSAKALDSDRDGSVDAFDLVFSGTVRGSSDRSAPFRFGVAGYRVTSAGAAKGRKVRINVAEAGTCDLAARPRISYRPGSGGLETAKRRPLRASSVVAGRAPRGAPKLICAATADGDSDGHVDAVVLGYSKKVRNRAQSSGRLPFEVDRYSVASVGRARGSNIALRLHEKDAYDTDALPAVIYRSPTAKRDRRFAVTGSGGRARSSTFNHTRDRAGARLLSTTTADANQNGLLDGVRAQFSEPVRAAPGAVDVTGAEVTGVASARSTLTADLREGPFDSASKPNVAFGSDSSLRDSAGNPTGRLTAAATDGAAPVITGATTADSGGAPGRVDALALTFSEPVAHAPDADGSYPFSVAGFAVRSAGGASGSTVSLSLAEASAPDGGVRPAVGYARGSGAPVTDTAGNEAASRSFSGTRDGVSPALTRAALLDTNINGQVDAVRYDFSEPVVHLPASCPACSFSLGGGYVLGSAGPGVGASVTVAVAEADNDATVTTASYSPMGGGVTDPAGNRAPAASLPTADASPPVATSAATRDINGNGRIDRIEVTFSEPVSLTAGAASETFEASGYAVAGVTDVAGDRISIVLAEAAELDTGSAPDITYTGRGAKLIDANGTEHARRGYPDLTRDEVAPIFVGARTADVQPAEGNKLDAIDLIFSEEITGPDQTEPFTGFSTSGGDVNAVTYMSDRVQVGFDEGGGFNTGALPTYSYGPGSGLQDVPEGSGDGPQSAPSASGQAVDAARPIVVGAATDEVDSPADGKVDSVDISFSEPIAYSAGPPSAIALTDPVLPISSVSSPTANQLRASVQEAALPDGGARPKVTVAEPTRITDPAGNPATATPFAGTDDGVGPALTAAQNGEEATPGSCVANSPVNGKIDCVRAIWSETVTQPASAGVFDNTPQAPLSVMSVSAASYTDVKVAEGANDRDVAGSLRYTGTTVQDVSGNAAVASPAIVKEPACADSGLGSSEPNDFRDVGNPELGGANTDEQQQLCAGDPDWWTVTAEPDGTLTVRVDPVPEVSVTVRLVDSSGNVLASGTSESPGAGVILTEQDLTPPATLVAGATYWVEISSVGFGEGAYCGQASAGSAACDDGDNTPE